MNFADVELPPVDRTMIKLMNRASWSYAQEVERMIERGLRAGIETIEGRPATVDDGKHLHAFFYTNGPTVYTYRSTEIVRVECEGFRPVKITAHKSAFESPQSALHEVHAYAGQDRGFVDERHAVDPQP